jgi:hypothetical protein
VVGNPAYLIVILLSRVVTRLGALGQVNPHVVEKLFATDLAYLQSLYNEVNRFDDGRITCPECRHEFMPEDPALGGSSATRWNGSAAR